MNRRLFLALPALAAAGGASWLALWSRPISRDALARAAAGARHDGDCRIRHNPLPLIICVDI